MASALSAAPAQAAPVVGFDPESIISDGLFYDSMSMTSSEIQGFLDSKIGSCQNGKCLNVLTAGISSRDAVYSQSTGNLICSAIQGGSMKVSELIYRVQVACGISARVILVTLQKEQGLTTSKAPSDWNLKAAMGASCPDTAPCDPAFSGVGPQILKGTQQLKTYKAAKFAKQPGVNWVGYNPNSGCGGTNLNIRNYATAALYSYTPYQPNAAALAAGFGLGDGCSSYGNRNFYNYYTQWFGSTQAAVDPCKQPPASAVTQASGYVSVTADALNARVAPTTDCPTILTQFSRGTVVEQVATFGGWAKVRAGGTDYWVSRDFLTAVSAPYTVDRLSGPSRYTTAVEVSRRAYPQGASTVLIASGVEFPDALAAGAAAGYTKAALLLTEPQQITGEVLAEVVRLHPTRVVIIGAEVRVSSAVAAALAGAVPSARIERVAGIDRYETSRLVAKAFFPSASSAYIATGNTYADAVVAAALGGSTGSPVVLVDGSASTADAATIAQLRASGVSRVIIAGSAAAVSDGIMASLSAAGFAVERRGGVDRYQTSQMLTQSVYPKGAQRALVATGQGFADALTGSVLATATSAPLLLTPAGCMIPGTKDWLLGNGVRQVTLIGGEPSLSGAVAAGDRC